ncbi:MAG: cytochrome c biogenesis protein DipZ [Chloroflexota bacterium]|nr:MAG: hypothetical protein DLM70_12305 [Chloroflexota bacterium]
MSPLLAFAFLSGFLTIFAPCVWPLLPVVLSASAVGNRKTALGIVVGVTGSFGLVTLSASYVVASLHVDPNTLRLVAVVVIAYLGVSMLVPALARLQESALSRFTNMLPGAGRRDANVLGSGMLLGVSLGVVWSPCAGPILATITTLALMARVSGDLVLVTACYMAGVAIPLFAFAYGGQRLLRRLTVMKRYSGHAHRVFGAVIVLTAIGIYSSYDKVVEAQLLNVAPQYSQTLIKFESAPAVQQQLTRLKSQHDSARRPSHHKRVALCPKSLCDLHYRAPAFQGISHWLNTARPLTLHSLRHRVVLVDFWTFDCINCIHTLPSVVNWYTKYRRDGFVVIGVHTPEFAYEKDTGNVQNALRRFNITYPVPQDNDFRTWNAYNNQYWPAEYLVDGRGYVRRMVAGEGSYGDTEAAIRALLRETGRHV